jgi:hypothetical protein
MDSWVRALWAIAAEQNEGAKGTRMPFRLSGSGRRSVIVDSTRIGFFDKRKKALGDLSR